jgi:hypothetical protein
MSSPSGSVRKRAGKDNKRGTSPNPAAVSEQMMEKVAHVVEKAKPYKPVQQGREWDYKLAISVLTVLAFVTRFWGIRHPDQVVFDEVHFGKVRRRVVEDPCSFHVPNWGPCPRRVCCQLTRHAVRLILPATNLLLRRPPALWKAPFRLRRLACWIQRRLLV